MSLFGNNNNQSNAGGLFGNNNTSSTGGLFGNITSTSNTPTLFGKPNNQPQTQGLFGTNNNSNGQNKNNQSSLFGNNISNNNNTTTNTTSNAGGSLFGNLGNNTGNIFGNLNNNNTNNTNNQQGGLFGAPTTNTNSSTDNKTSFGLFQNNNTGANTTTQTSNLNAPIFGQQNTTTQSTQPAPTLGLQNNKSDNNFSLFSNDNQKALGKPATNDNNTQSQAKPQNSLFSNITSGTSLFGAPKPEEKKQNETNNLFNNTNTQAQNQTQPQTQNKESEEKKIETKPQNALFGANINSQAGTGSNSLFSNIANNKPEEKKNENNNNNNNQGLNATNILNQNQNPLNQNQPKKENKDELNNLNNNDLNIKIPEKPFDVSLSNAKELEEFEKNQMLYKTNGEILEEFKKMLFNQQAKYKQCVQNTRKFEQKVMGLIEITNTNAIISKHNGKKGKKIIDKINTINHLSKNLENIITNFNDKLNANLIPFKDNIMNSDKFLLNENNSEKFKFYENFDQISDKCYLIENAVNEAEQNFFKKEKEIGEKNKNEQDGIWIEKNNKKIFINQNEMNNLFSECYDGLANLKNMQDNIDKQYEILKSKLIKSNRNNYNMNFNINNIY